VPAQRESSSGGCMNWQEKFAEITTLCGDETCLRFRAPHNWYVADCRASVGGDGFLRSICGNGDSPEAAVIDFWNALQSIPSNRFLVVRPNGHEQRYRRAGNVWIMIADESPRLAPQEAGRG
jgi:hypothetical protein